MVVFQKLWLLRQKNGKITIFCEKLVRHCRIFTRGIFLVQYLMAEKSLTLESLLPLLVGSFYALAKKFSLSKRLCHKIRLKYVS